MKLLQRSLLFFLIIIFGCKRDQLEWKDTALYHANVIVNNELIKYGIEINGYYKDSLITFELERVTDDGTYWELSFGAFNKQTQDMQLMNYDKNFPWAFYSGYCCVPPYAPWPDLPVAVYHVWEPDSIDNFLNVIVDTSTQQLSGNFKVTFVNKSDPYDTLRMSCPSFNCYW